MKSRARKHKTQGETSNRQTENTLNFFWRVIHCLPKRRRITHGNRHNALLRQGGITNERLITEPVSHVSQSQDGQYNNNNNDIEFVSRVFGK